MVVATPVAQFPFGSNMPPERCTAIIDWARAHNGWVFEDDTNSEYRWSGTPRPPLITLGQQDKQPNNRVIYAGSFNRALAPGMRLAFIVVPADLIDAFTAAQQMSGSHYPLMLQRTVADFLKDGRFARHLRKQRPIYQQRAEALIDALQKTFGDRLELAQLEAGLQLTVVTAEPCDDVAISDAALRVGLDVPALSPHCRLPQKLTGFLLGFGNTPVERIPNAVARLEKVMTQVQQRSALPR
jgi:GntR family transcriptional regulator/MocR family aminotransferase